MRILSRIINAVRRRIVVFYAKSSLEMDFLAEAKRFYELTCRYNANVDTDDDIVKMQYMLRRENHVIEKGMSMKNSRRGFGQEKVSALIERLKEYHKRYGVIDTQFLNYPLDTVREYIDYTRKMGVEIPQIEASFSELCKMVSHSPVFGKGGVALVRREDIQDAARGNFESLLSSRHSIRYFDQATRPTSDQIVRALEMAQRTPSACNRQAWHAHVFQGERSVELVKWQGGSRGFEDEVTASILVTADLKGFLSHEVHQAYVDGGLYAMNLINALHYLGFGTIPLSMGFGWQKLKELRDFGISENEVPILIVGFGNLLPEFKVAISTRNLVSIL